MPAPCTSERCDPGTPCRAPCFRPLVLAEMLQARGKSRMSVPIAGIRLKPGISATRLVQKQQVVDNGLANTGAVAAAVRALL